LESIEIWCGKGYSNEKGVLEIVAKENKTQKKLLSLVGPENLNNETNMKVIEKYKRIGVIKKFKFRDYDGGKTPWYFEY
jgi:hypothetical protein